MTRVVEWNSRLRIRSYSEEVRYVSTSIIRQATDHSETTRIELTPWDLRLLLSQYIQKGLLFTKPAGKQSEQEETNIISHLKVSLSETLDHFFPLAGRLAITKHDDDDGTISVNINCNSAGAEFIHATADVTIADYPWPQLRSPHRCSINHTICDGTSFWHFLNSWSEISRSGGSNHISRPTVFKRWFFENTNCPIRLPFSTDDEFIKNYTPPPPPVDGRVFHFTPENISKLKAKANLLVSDQANESSMISFLHVVLAHLWVAITRASCLDPNEETSYQLAIDNRTRLNPPLPESYFGNSVQAVIATAKVGELLERGIELGTSLLNQVVKSHNDAAIRRFLVSWMEKPTMMIVFNGSVSTLVTVGSTKFNIYGNDFGWGQPIAVRSGFTNHGDGKTTVFAGRVEGSIDIEACFYLETLKGMENDSAFMEAITVLPHSQSV
ncbi:Transferase [Macleaya cordata]|uniref:Transferase n=1 Tax=Macleaya cordata TaxID=56857 RepID=A0A200RDH9_MACCD|nr:Transferase [Macleaya cordata]